MNRAYRYTWLLCLAFISLSSISTQARVGGNGTTGGGGTCERHIRELMANISDWMKSDGPSAFHYPKQLTKASYIQKMLNSIAIAHVRCVSPGDPGFPVMVDGAPKDCRFDTLGSDKASSKAQQFIITCSDSKFMGEGPDDQLFLIHHELAGLSGIELPLGESNDISTYDLTEEFKHFYDYSSKILSPKRDPNADLKACHDAVDPMDGAGQQKLQEIIGEEQDFLTIESNTGIKVTDPSSKYYDQYKRFSALTIPVSIQIDNWLKNDCYPLCVASSDMTAKCDNIRFLNKMMKTGLELSQ